MMSLKNLKFRAWDKQEREFVPYLHNVVLKHDGTIEGIEYEMPHEGIVYNDISYFELMQSTGLKDKNGVEIYEGDILKGPMDFGPAGFVQSVAPVSYHKINGYQLHYFLLEHTEVIGNVYEDKNIKFGTMEEWWIVIADGLLKW